jgi:L-alanine-DL-glutamate epimerase-like enolase superfamily enzyme
MSNHKVVRITVTNVNDEKIGGDALDPTVPWLCTPLTHFSDYRKRQANYGGKVGFVVVEIETDSGIIGVGSCGTANSGIKRIIEDHFAPLVIGEDPFKVELIWSKLYRSSARFGRRGVAISAISGIDIALWDIMGKALNAPVYDLLGGKTRDEIQVYASRMYALKDLDALKDEARGYVKEGFTMLKQRFGFGPADGVKGMKGNIALIKAVRDAVGDEVEVSADAYMGWDLEYAIKMERELRPYGLKWIEEALMPHDVNGYARLCSVSQTPISHGEHSYTRWDFQEIIEKGAAHILQPDVNRVGGITEARKIWAMAAAKDLPVVPHGNDLHNLHLVFSQVNTPFTEYFPNISEGGYSHFWNLFEGNPIAKDGKISIGDKPGLGYTLDKNMLATLTLKE